MSYPSGSPNPRDYPPGDPARRDYPPQPPRNFSRPDPRTQQQPGGPNGGYGQPAEPGHYGGYPQGPGYPQGAGYPQGQGSYQREQGGYRGDNGFPRSGRPPQGEPQFDPWGSQVQTQVIDAYPQGGEDDDGEDQSKGGKRRLKDGKKARRRKRIRKILLISLAVVLLLGGGGAFAGWRYLRSVENKVTKVDAFESIPEVERPAVVSTKAMNILLLGTDTRDPDASGSRTDTIMVAHVTQDHKTSQIVSIPRDSWVDIPKSPDGKHGGVKGKINWAFAWGGIPLMVRTVESVSKVRIDHVVLIDFAGFKEIVDAVGGIDIDNDVTFTSFFWENDHHVFKKGRLHLDGNLALDYARQRKMLAGGDFDRIKHQQMVVKAVMDKATSKGVIADPGKLTAFLTSVAKTITTDKKFDMLSTAMDLRGISSKNVKFITAPTKGTGRVGDQSVVFYDFAKADTLFTALKNDQAASWKE